MAEERNGFGDVRIGDHVKAYAPYYAAAAAIVVLLSIGLAPKGGDDAASSANTAATNGGAATGPGGAGVRGPSGIGARGVVDPATAGTLLAGATTNLDGAEAIAQGAGDALTGQQTPPAVTPPTTPDAPSGLDDIPQAPDVAPPPDDACSVNPGTTLPPVAPAREVDDAQTTAEDAVGVDAPADPAPYIEDGAQQAGCDDVAIPDPPAPSPPPAPDLPTPPVRIPI